ncbi:riboflavin synthase [bacterium]|nr:riboflavin synthase [bacterium]
MFTGLVEGLGSITAVVPEVAGIRLTLRPPEIMIAAPDHDRCQLGDSVAVNGCCLTVIEIHDGEWSFQAGTETLSKTNLGRLTADDVVNLERSLPVQGRLGGHFVQGHVDGVGTVTAIETDGDWITMRFQVSPDWAKLMVPKGSVAVDGVSLTIVDVNSRQFSIALIPHTLEVTTLGRRKVGDAVNIETDILGKYVQKLLGK